MENYFVTTSLPYANGPLHLGHLLEHIQADIWVRFLKMRGHRCVFVSGDDVHGSAIMLAAEKAGVSPLAYVEDIAKGHKLDLKEAGIGFDLFHTTNDALNQAQVERMYHTLHKAGLMPERSISQAYDEEKNMFLPDRYVKGTCPKCGAMDQYGDNCEVCGATYAPGELIEAYSVLSGSAPTTRSSKHVFFGLSQCHAWLDKWMATSELQTPVRNKLKEWLEKGLQDWDITRDGPYFGFEIPGRPDQYFYVWMDAPIGYLSILQKLDAQEGRLDFDEVWEAQSPWKVWHFIGKDIVNFHGVFWPALLHSSGLRCPSGLHVHGFLTINGEKMSKSRGTFVTARQYLKAHSAEYLRYYMAAKLGDSVVDIDLSWDDFSKRCNADLVGKVVNIGSRCASFMHKMFEGRLCSVGLDHPILHSILEAKPAIERHYQNRHFQNAVKEIMQLADQVNQFIDQEKPWVLAKQPGQEARVHEICSTGLEAFKRLMVYLTPIIPETSAKVADFFAQETLEWEIIEMPGNGGEIGPFPRLLERVDFAKWFDGEQEKQRVSKEG